MDSTFHQVFHDANELARTQRELAVLNIIGYAAISQYLVPYKFISKLLKQIEGREFSFEDVHSMSDLCGEEYWESLTEQERQAASHCLVAAFEYTRACSGLRPTAADFIPAPE